MQTDLHHGLLSASDEDEAHSEAARSLLAADVGAELLFQIIADRTEQAAVILTTNLPFSEWTQVIPNARLCKALLDRITDRAHIIETGSDSYRFRRTVEKRKKNT